MTKQRPPRTLMAIYRLGALLLIISVLGAAIAAPSRALAQPQIPSDGSTLYMPQITKDMCNAAKTPSLMGTQSYSSLGVGSPYHQPLMKSGATWMRVDVSWSSAEPTNTTPDQYNWAFNDAQTILAIQKCFPLVVTLSGNPSWASSLSEGYLTKTNVAELAQFMGALAERYDGDGIQDAPGSPKVLYFELYNEPDVGRTSLYERWGDAADKYAEMLKAVYPAIKAANPRAQVVFGGIAYDFFTDQDPKYPENNGPFVRSFFENVLKNGGGPYFDIMNFHFYPLFGPNWTKNFPKDGPGLVEKTAAVRSIMSRYGLNKPVIITEAAWHNNATVPFGDDTLQVRYVQKLFAQAMVAGVPMLAWWPFSDAGGAYGYNSGLVTEAADAGTTLKPAYFAYVVFGREIAPATFVAEIDADPDMKVYKFLDNTRNRTLYVAWTNPTDLASSFGVSVPYQDTTRTDIIVLNGTSAAVYDAFWTKVADVTDGADGRNDNKIKITINGDPKYIVLGGN